MLLSKGSKMSEVNMALVRHFTEVSLDSNGFVKKVNEEKTKEIEFIDVPDEGSAYIENDIKDKKIVRKKLTGFKDVTADTIAVYYGKTYNELDISDIYNFLIDIFSLSKLDADRVISDVLDKLTTCRAIDIFYLYAGMTSFQKVIVNSLKNNPMIKRRYTEVEASVREGYISLKKTMGKFPKPPRSLCMIAFLTNDFNSFYLLSDGLQLALSILNSKSISIADSDGKSTDINKIEGVKISRPTLDDFPKIVRSINKANLCLLPTADNYITCDIFSAVKYSIVKERYQKIRKSIDRISGNLKLAGYFSCEDINDPVLRARNLRTMGGEFLGSIVPQEDTISRKASSAKKALDAMKILYTSGFDIASAESLFKKYVNVTTSDTGDKRGSKTQGSSVSKPHSYSNCQLFLILVEGLASLRKLVDYCNSKDIDILSIPSDIFIKPTVGMRFKTLEDYLYSYKYFKELDNEYLREYGKEFDGAESVFDVIKPSDQIICEQDGIDFSNKIVPTKTEILSLAEIGKLRFSLSEKALEDNPDLYNDKECLTLGISVQRYFNKQYANKNPKARDFIRMVYDNKNPSCLTNLYLQYSKAYRALYNFLNSIVMAMNNENEKRIRSGMFECKFIITGATTLSYTYGTDKTCRHLCVFPKRVNDTLQEYKEFIETEKIKFARELTAKLGFGVNKEVTREDISISASPDIHINILNIKRLEKADVLILNRLIEASHITDLLNIAGKKFDISTLGDEESRFFNLIRLITMGYTVTTTLYSLCNKLSEINKNSIEALRDYEINTMVTLNKNKYLFRLPKKIKSARYSDDNINMIISCMNRLPFNYYVECLNGINLRVLKENISPVYDFIMKDLWRFINFIADNKKVIDNWIYNLGRVDTVKSLRENFIKASEIIRLQLGQSREHNADIDELIRNRNTHISEHMFVVTKEGDYVSYSEGGHLYYLHANNIWYCPELGVKECKEVVKNKSYSIILQHSEV